jgi:hypothetical protein
VGTNDIRGLYRGRPKRGRRRDHRQSGAEVFHAGSPMHVFPLAHFVDTSQLEPLKPTFFVSASYRFIVANPEHGAPRARHGIHFADSSNCPKHLVTTQ